MKNLTLKIHGMHCASCEVLVERKFKKIPGVERVKVNQATGKADVEFAAEEPNLQTFRDAIQQDGYNVSYWSAPREEKKTAGDYVEVGAIFLIVVSWYLILKKMDLLPEVQIGDSMGYGLIFLIGLAASVSTCMAVTGGLLMAAAAKYNQMQKNVSSWQNMKPLLSFNIGRVVSYTVFGGAVGALGSVLSLSPQITGWVTIAVSAFMIILGFQILEIFPGLRRFAPRMPKFISHRVHDWSEPDRPGGPFLLGAATFFLPCGFTQALQLYVLSSGSWLTGALTMLVFSLGTMPALMSLSAISSFAKGAFQHYFLRFAGVVVIVLGITNVNSGLALAGFSPIDLPGLTQAPVEQKSGFVPLQNGVQIAEMRVNGYSYFPSQFRVRAGIPVEWRINGSGAAGCAQVITMPDMNITQYLPKTGVKTIRFTPQRPGTYRFSCTMGMTTPGAAFIVEGDGAAPSVGQPQDAANDDQVSDANAQKFAMEISRANYFQPNLFQVKNNVPVELTVDDQIQLGGCMGTMIIPKYGVAKRLSLGRNVIRFTPTEPGDVWVTCSMGSRLAKFVVTE